MLCCPRPKLAVTRALRRVLRPGRRDGVPGDPHRPEPERCGASTGPPIRSPGRLVTSRSRRADAPPAGFVDIGVVDQTEQFRTTAAAWIREWDAHRDELVALHGEAEFDTRQHTRNVQLQAIDDGLLRRSLVHTAAAEGVIHEGQEDGATVARVRWRFEDCVLDVDRFELRHDGQPVALEPQAMRILIELINHRDKVVAKTQLLDSVWGDRFVSESALTTQIKELRRAVGDTGRDQRIIKTVHGRGYMFIAPVHDDTAPAAPEPGAERRNPVLAVLPFANLTAEPGRDHLAEGLTHDIITALSKHRWLRVLARATAAEYAGGSDTAVRLRDELDVDYVVEGTVRLSGGRLRVTASLTDTREGVGGGRSGTTGWPRTCSTCSTRSPT